MGLGSCAPGSGVLHICYADDNIPVLPSAGSELCLRNPLFTELVNQAQIRAPWRQAGLTPSNQQKEPNLFPYYRLPNASRLEKRFTSLTIWESSQSKWHSPLYRVSVGGILLAESAHGK